MLPIRIKLIIKGGLEKQEDLPPIIWGNCHFYSGADTTDYDWLVVYDEIPTNDIGTIVKQTETLPCSLEHTLLVTCEPPNIKLYSPAYIEQFGYVLSTHSPVDIHHPHHLIAAFFMLLFQPGWLFDVGFQLSFCAVVAILLIQPKLYRIIPVTHRVGRYVWGLMSVSLAAQVGTAPLVLLYFSRFSTHFLLTNLVVIPLVFIIMYAAVGLLLLTPFPVLQSAVAFLVKGLIEGLNSSVRWVEQLPWASLDNVWIYPLEVFAFYLLLLLLIRYCYVRSAQSLMGSLLCLLFLCVFHTVMRWNDSPRQSLEFYNIRGCPAVHCIAADGRSWIVYADSFPDEKRLHRAVSSHWQRLRLDSPQPVVTAEYTADSFVWRNRILSFSGYRVCCISDNRWRYQTASSPLSVDYLYLCRGYDGRVEWLSSLFSFRTVILDSSLSNYRLEAFKSECRRLGIHYISLSEKGSVRFLL